MSFIAVLRIFVFYLLAVLVATILGCLVQTQINLAALQQLDVPISWSDRLTSSWQDLLNFTRIFGIMVAAALLPALPVAAVLSRIFRPWRWLLFALAGALGIWAAFIAANLYLPMPTFIAATRETYGLLAMMAAVAVGSWLFGYLTRPKSKRGLRVLG